MSSRRLWCVVILTSALTFGVLERTTLTGLDFRAFYCAGAAAREHKDPYRTQPLQRCEIENTDRYFTRFSRSVALPAPLPGYDIALFQPLSLLPFSVAEALWDCLIGLLVATALFALTGFTGLRGLTVFAAIWLSLAFPALEFGELIAIAVAGICIAALYAQRGDWKIAGAGAVLALVEPHLGLPVWLALFVWKPQARPALLTGAAVLIVLSLVTLGYAQNLEYFATILPLHALSELGSDAQLSSSVVFHYLGAPDGLAIRLGSLWYALMVLIAIALAGVFARRAADGAFLVALPAALGILGGSFIHVTDMAAGLPLATLAYARVPRYRNAIGAGIILLALPWWHLALMIGQHQFGFAAMAAVVAAYLAWDLFGESVSAALRWFTATSIFLVTVSAWYVASAHALQGATQMPAIKIDPAYPEATWAWANAKFISTGSLASWLLRIPSWLGLSIVIAASCALLYRARIDSPISHLPETAPGVVT